MVVKFLKHLRPVKVNSKTVKFSATYGLGGILTLLFFLLTVTGIILMFFYIPTRNQAYISVKKITYIIPFTGFFRDLHRISGEAMIIAAFLHMLRIVSRQAFDNKYRVLNWITGVLLFLLIFPLNFTGYLLPWDNVSYWGATIVLNIINSIPLVGEKLRLIIAGGNILNTDTLIRFYTYHIIVLPCLFFFLMMNHFYLVRAAKGIKVTKEEGIGDRVSVSELFKAEIICTLVIIIILTALCYFFYNAPLTEDANKSIIPVVIKAPWYFLSIQFLLTYLPPLAAGVIIPVLYIIFLIFFYKIKKIHIFLFVHFMFVLFTILELFVK